MAKTHHLRQIKEDLACLQQDSVAKLLDQTRANSYRVTAVYTDTGLKGPCRQIRYTIQSASPKLRRGKRSPQVVPLRLPNSRARLRKLSKQSFGELKKIFCSRVGELLSFMNASGWFCRFAPTSWKAYFPGAKVRISYENLSCLKDCRDFYRVNIFSVV